MIMYKTISNERLAQLTKLGFGDVPDCDPSFAFGTKVLAYDTMMSVQGDHATDRAYVYYSCVQYENEELDGFFFAPSLLECMVYPYREKWSFESLLQEICDQLGCEARLVWIGSFPMIYVEITEYDWKIQNIVSSLSDILKLIGVLDYILPHEYRRLLTEYNYFY